MQLVQTYISNTSEWQNCNLYDSYEVSKLVTSHGILVIPEPHIKSLFADVEKQ